VKERFVCARRLMKVSSALLLVMLTVGGALAQEDTTTVRGTVVDPQNNPVAGATVKLTNPAKNFTRTQTTNESGSYAFSLVQPGTYQLEVEAGGFKKAAISNVNAPVNTPVDINVPLEIGNVNETVTINSGAESALNTTDASIGNTFESRRIEELPLNARNIVGLLSLQPGVTRQGEVNGGRRDQSNITLDGIDINEQQTGLDVVAASLNSNDLDGSKTREAFSGVLRSTPDSVQEFRVTTSLPNSNQGRSSGGQVSLVTKSGTNDFHGSLYWFHRNTVTTSNDWFNNAAGRYSASDSLVQQGLAKAGDQIAPRPKLLRNIYGGSIGGAAIKDRLFFFYNYEGRRDAAGQSVLQVVPTETLRQGIVRYNNSSGGITTLTPANIATLYPGTGGINPAGLAILRSAPLPNSAETGDGLNVSGFRFNAPISTELSTHIARFDLMINDRQTLFVRGNYQNDLYGQAPAFPGTPSPGLWVHPYGFVAGHTWTVTNSLVNNARVGLTRQAFSQQGDSTSNLVNFRFVYQPFLYQRALNRTTPVWNITDDVSWIKGTHTVQLGTNLRFIRNNRESFANSFDTAIINPSAFLASGSTLSDPLTDLSPASNLVLLRGAVAAVLGRVSQYSANVIYDIDGKPTAAGSPSARSFATEEYEFYGQDVWKIRPNLTLTFGLHYGVSTPVYERNGFQVSPTVDLGEFFQQRVDGAANGQPFRQLLTLDLAGEANNKPGFYKTDWNNFAPLATVAWSPDFGDNFLGHLIGRSGRSVIRGGFRTVYDRIGSALAVNFDLNSRLGFSASSAAAFNACDQTTSLCPLLTGLEPDVRTYPRLVIPPSLTFPFTHPTAGGRGRLDTTIDNSLTTPKQYLWNVSYGRELPKGFSFEMSYVGRLGRDLLLVRDAMALNNLVDTKSGTDWYTAAGQLAVLREANAPITSVAPIPYFQNLFPGLAGTFNVNGVATPLTATQAAYRRVARRFVNNNAAQGAIGGLNTTDWTFVQELFDDRSILGPGVFYHPQYAALATWSSIGTSDYHGALFTFRQRFKSDLAFDINYTLSKSMDDGSALEAQAATSNFLRNSLDTKLNRSVSNFDMRHNLNANWLVGIPIGRGKRLLGDLPTVANAFLGGWQLSGIFRYHSGMPVANGIGSPFELGTWASNWQLSSSVIRIRPVEEGQDPNVPDPTGVTSGDRPNIFSDPVAAYQSFRSPRAGEVGDRNTFRLPSYIVLDAGLSKTFDMWYSEGHKLQFRWEVFNVTNTQRFGVISSFGAEQDPYLGRPGSDFGRYIGSQTPVGETRPGRVMQFALRYRF
jgi:hypothetical protein